MIKALHKSIGKVMLVTIEYLKKETISLASLVEQNFLSQSNLSQIKERQKDLHKIHKSCLRYLVRETIPRKRNIRFVNAVMNITNSLVKIYQVSDKLKLANIQSEVFKTELNELNIETSDKIRMSIDSFSYLDESMALKTYALRSKLHGNLELVQKNITLDILESPNLTEEGIKAINNIYYLKQIDEEINEIIENVLYIDKRLSPSWEEAEKLTNLNMLDFIHKEKMVNTGDYNE
jgi:hypothetical protein